MTRSFDALSRGLVSNSSMVMISQDQELWESSLAIIKESRRIRAVFQEEWSRYLDDRRRQCGFGLSLLNEVSARRAAEVQASTEGRRRAIDDLC